jgi:hypothetical protein
MDILDLSFEYTASLYSRLPYWGLIEISIRIKNILGIQSRPISLTSSAYLDDHFTQNVSDNELEWRLRVPMTTLVEPVQRQKEFLAIMNEISWSLSEPISREILISKLQERGRKIY